MLGYNYERYLQDIARNSSSANFHQKQMDGKNIGIEIKITVLNGTLSQQTQIDKTDFSFTLFDKQKGRVIGIDNQEYNKPLHLHSGGTTNYLTGSTHTIASAGSKVLSAINACLTSY